MPVKTVAIVGSHIRTREAAPWDRRYVDIWLFNEAVSQGWPKRADAVFQMHAETVWRNPLNRNDGNYPAWMAKAHPFPIYMQREYADVPASRAYPLDAVCTELLPALYKGRGKDRRQIAGYFTSSIAYALALAIYEGYERIFLYGVEMESDTEYTYQRDGVFFWLGIAAGRGIEVTVHEESGFFKEPLYGYEGDASLQRSHFQARIELLERVSGESQMRMDKAQAGLVALMEEFGLPRKKAGDDVKRLFARLKDQVATVVEFTGFQGALAEARRYANKADVMDEHGGEHIFARQEFEIVANQTSQILDQRQAAMHVAGGSAQVLWKQMRDAIDAGDAAGAEALSAKFFEAHEQYIREASEFGRLQGVLNENTQYIGMVDELIKAAGGKKSEEAILAARNGHLVPEAVHV